MTYKDNSIYVVPNSVKNNILKELNTKKLLNIKFITIEELIDRLTFAYDKKTINYLMKKYNLKYDVSLVYLNNLKYISEDFNLDYLKKLIDIKNDLEENNLLIKDNYINNFLSNKEIIVYGYDYIPKFYKKYLDVINATRIKKEIKDYKHNIYEFKNIDDEIEYVATKIIDLINEGIDINNIKIANINDDYINPIKRIFNLYNLPITLPNKEYIYDSVIISDFINLIKDNSVINALEILKNKYDLNDEDNNYIYNKLISILNEYSFIDDKKTIINNLIYEFKHTKVNTKILKNKVEVIDLKNNIIDDNSYVFLMNFNSNSIPVIYKDDDFLSDSIKEKIGIETSNELNKIERETTLNIIKSIKNLTITYKLRTPYDDFIKSNLLDDYKLEPKKVSVTNKYSNKMNYYKLSNKLDDLIKFNKKSDDLDYLYSIYKDINFRTFDNSYKKINNKDLFDYLNNKISLSYSSMNNFYKCKFRYYLENILYLSKEEDTFMLTIGNIFHELLSKSFDENFDLDKEFKKVIDKYNAPKEKFFLNKLKGELNFVIDTIKYQNTFSSLDKSLYENKVYVNKEGSIKLTFTGTIDKLLYKNESDKTYLVIIDYKTGNPDINLSNSIYGIDMQLPVYLYLSKNIKEINNIEVIGFYLQRVLDNEITKVNNKTYDEIKRENLKLLGYTNSNEELISKFDKNYFDSDVIKSMKKGNNGFSNYAKLINKDEIDKLISLTEKHIDNAFNDILNSDFKINPKVIGDKLVSCNYCKYKDVCFRKEENISYLKEHKGIDFLKDGD